MSVIISTRLNTEQLERLDKIRGSRTRSEALREFFWGGINQRHEMQGWIKDGRTCSRCGLPEDSSMHLSYTEIDRLAMQDIIRHEAAVVDSHAEG